MMQPNYLLSIVNLFKNVEFKLLLFFNKNTKSKRQTSKYNHIKPVSNFSGRSLTSDVDKAANSEKDGNQSINELVF